MDDWGDFQEEMIQHFVKVKKGPDILRWGYTNRGSVSIKESYNITLGNHEEDDGIWKKKWTVNLWPKVSLFVWLVVRVSILTNENLRLCGVQGPSQLCLCYQEEESMGHLLDKCTFAASIWNKGVIGF